MSGHSKWSQIKRQKGVTDSRRGKLFTKIGREIEAATRGGGPQASENPVLRLALSKARQANMPKETIERAIKRVTAGGGGASWEEIRYEAYGPGGAALLIDTLTNNRKRTVAEVRAILSKGNASMGENGSVAWVFEPQGVIAIDVQDGVDPDAIALQAIDAGADDVSVDKTLIEVLMAPPDLEAVRERLEAEGVPLASAEVTMRPTTTVPLDGEQARSLLRLLDSLEELDDVQRVYSNADVPEAVMVESESAA